MENDYYYDVIVIGAGIAGMTAAIYVRRAGKSVLVLEGKVYGGQIIQTLNVANWPGEAGISGAELSQNIYQQVQNFGAELRYEEVLEVIDGELMKKVVTDAGEYAAKAIIIATGAKEKKLGMPREEALTGKGISYCATCDGAFYRDKAVAVIGGGNTALYEALYLSGIAGKVYLVHRRKELRGAAPLAKKLKRIHNVEFVLESEPVEFLGLEHLEGLVVKKLDGRLRTLDVAGVFIAIGRQPETEVFRNLVDCDENGYIIAGEDCKTSRPGIYVAGDCRTKAIRQLVTAAGDGAVAATEAVRNLK